MKGRCAGKSGRLRINVGVNTLAEAEYFLNRGADEIYCGYSGVPSHFSGRPPFSSAEELAAAIRLAHKTGSRVYVAANEVHCRGAGEVIAQLKKLAAAGVDGFIVKDLETLALLRSSGISLDCHLSTLALCFNSRVLEFYGGLGISRCVIPEHLPPGEAGALLRNPYGVETEFFFLPRYMCVNIDGICLLCDSRFCLGQGDTKLCQSRLDLAGGGEYSMPVLTPRQRLGCFYDYARGADVLKLDRTSDFDLRKEMFGAALEMLRLVRLHRTRPGFLKAAQAASLELARRTLGPRSGPK
ncbi:MAG TPA: U32 family peptidase [Elusimicrobiales bacterium]|nr:U32 family peptidase [Elusimicrobiales bacterium]